jgi:deoxyribose-phosphate aldolase
VTLPAASNKDERMIVSTMKNLDEATIERIIEQITRNVLILIQDEGQEPPGNGSSTISAHNYVERVQPVVNAGADRIASTLGVAPTDGRLAHMIDHTILKPEASQDEIAQLCYEARKFNFASVCVNPTNVKLCAELLESSGIPVCTVVGFPLGATPTDVKVFETQKAIRDGATEVDMVINVGALKSRDYELVERDIASIARVCHADNAILKVIIEAALLTDEEKVVACQLAKVAGADFVKTSTGFGPGGATVEDVALMRRVVGPSMGVKAAGGIRTYEDAQKMIAAGASRLGASASVKIVQGAEK